MADERPLWARGLTGSELQGMRQAHQYLRHLELGETKNAHRLLARLPRNAHGTQGIAQLAVVGQCLRLIALEHGRAMPGGRELEAARGAELNQQLRDLPRRPPDLPALMAWVVASGEHAAEVLRRRWPEQEKRLLWVSTAARVSYQAEDATGH